MRSDSSNFFSLIAALASFNASAILVIMYPGFSQLQEFLRISQATILGRRKKKWAAAAARPSRPTRSAAATAWSPKFPAIVRAGLLVSDAADTPDELRAKWLEFRAYAAAKARGRLGSMSGFRRGFSDSNAVKNAHLQCSSHHFRAKFR